MVQNIAKCLDNKVNHSQSGIENSEVQLVAIELANSTPLPEQFNKQRQDDEHEKVPEHSTNNLPAKQVSVSPVAQPLEIASIGEAANIVSQIAQPLETATGEAANSTADQSVKPPTTDPVDMAQKSETQSLDYLSQKLSRMESSVTELLLDLKCVFKNTKKTDETEIRIDNLTSRIETLHTDVRSVAEASKSIEKHIHRLTDSTNKKFSEIMTKIDSLEKTQTSPVTQCHTCTNCGYLPTGSSNIYDKVGTESTHNVTVAESDCQPSGDSDNDSSCSEDSDTSLGTVVEQKVLTPQKCETVRKPSHGHQNKNFKERANDTVDRRPPVDLLIVGNSNTSRINGRRVYSKKTCRVVTLRNKSIGGAIQYVKGMTSDRVKPECAAFLVGTAEIQTHSVTQIVSECKELFNHCKSNMPNTSLVLMGIPARRGDPRAVSSANQELESLCQKENVHFVYNDNIDYHEHLEADKIHINEAGIRVLVRNLKQTVNPILGFKSTVTPRIQYPRGRQPPKTDEYGGDMRER